MFTHLPSFVCFELYNNYILILGYYVYDLAYLSTHRLVKHLNPQCALKNRFAGESVTNCKKF